MLYCYRFPTISIRYSHLGISSHLATLHIPYRCVTNVQVFFQPNYTSVNNPLFGYRYFSSDSS
uniref:Ovule protein n=1 Tax=Schistosoma curassoni TaxID=6186 RepID=A0A183JGM1_9TREM